MKQDADAAFDRDVPEALREDAYQMMAEAASGCASHPSVTIHERDRIDAVNVRASGSIEIEGREFSFQMEDGNSRGTVLLAWNDDRPFEWHEPTRWALQPAGDIIAKALEAGRGAFLVAKWDAMLKQADIQDIPRAYGYDKHFAPGVITERHWRERAARRHLVIVDEETAASTRRQLLG